MTLMFEKRCFYKTILLLVLLIFVIAIVPNVFANLQSVKSIEIYSEKLNYKEKEPGSWKITKSAKWINQGEAEITIELDSILKLEEKYTDMIFVLDTSGSMEGERLDMLKSTTTSLADKLLSDENNRVALITFDQGSSIVSELTNEKDTFIGKVNSLTAQWVTNYYQALVNVDRLMRNYIKEDNRECVVVFLTDGYPNYDTPNEVGQYNYLKKTYPYLLINAIQYEMGNEVTEAVKRISDNQYVANVENLESILNEASVIPMVYENFNIEDFVDTNYFYVESKNDINCDIGSVTFDKMNQKVTWNINKLRTGRRARITIKVKLKEGVGEELLPTNEGENITSILGKTGELVESKLTPVLKEKYDVMYDVNAPSECHNVIIPDAEKHSVFETVGVSGEKPKCEGYQFKGWKYVSNSAERINDDYFMMPEEDVNIKGTWSRLNISKTMDGTVKESLTLYKQVQEDFNNPSKYVRKYTGDTSTFNGKEDVYYYYGAAVNNNVIFANYCWKIVRTTDTGGVKLIYNGVPSSNGMCNNSGEQAILTASDMGRTSYAVPFNTKIEGSLAQSSFMFNSDTAYVNKTKDLTISKTILGIVSMTEGNDFFYSNKYTFDGKQYVLENPEQYVWDDSYKDLVEMYTCRSVSSSGICNTLTYVVGADESRMYYIELSKGNGIEESGYETSITLSDSMINNGDGTFTLTNPVVVNKNDWYSNHEKYRKKYTCDNNLVTCNEMKYILDTSNTLAKYLNVDSNLVYGNSFEWDGENYKLKDTIETWNPYEDGALNNNHYSCFNNTGICENGKIYYIFFQDDKKLVYIEISDGKNVEDALGGLFYGENVNRDSATIKEAIDYWYQNNMTAYTKYLEDTVWCSDRSMANALTNGWNPNGGNILKAVKYGYSDNLDNLTCQNKSDRFTVYKENGNGALTYPVGLITVQEQALAYNKESPLGANQNYWMITPQEYRGFAIRSLYVSSLGGRQELTSRNGNYGNMKFGARPVVSIRPNLEYSIGDGSVENPYVIVLDN